MKVWTYSFDDGEYIMKEEDVTTIIHSKHSILFNCGDRFREMNGIDPFGSITTPFKLNKSQLKKFLYYMARGNYGDWVYK